MLAPVHDDTLDRLKQQHAHELELRHLVEAGVDRLPLPGSGRTLARWRVLAEVAAHDLSLVKLFEGHTDALAILSELGAPCDPDKARWATWCAEPPTARVELQRSARSALDPVARVHLHGLKSWCSGAAQATHALVSCWNEAGEPCLAAVALHQDGVTVTQGGWQAVGMAGSGSVDVRFEHAEAVQVGGPSAYLKRPGFWQGGAGIAACWFGGALGIARRTRALCGPEADPHRLAHLGAIDVALTAGAAVLRECAAWIDRNPPADAQGIALRARLCIEAVAQDVMQHAGRAVGAGPLCKDPAFARAMADLPVFLRQSHAERDLASLGRWLLDAEGATWAL